MTEHHEHPTDQDTALASMVLLLSFLDRPADSGQLRHLLGKGSEIATADDLVRLARKLDVRARKVSVRKRRLDDMPMPAIAPMQDGSHVVLLQVSADKALIFHPHDERPITMERSAFVLPATGLATCSASHRPIV